MKKNALISLITVLLVFSSHAQKKFSGAKKISNGKGTLWGYWGYNRSNYTKSDLHLKGPGYDFTLKGATASDNPSKSLDQYVNIKTITVPQFNLRVGYYYKDRYSISLGYDHMKYVFDDANQVLLDGTINPGLDSTWSGTYHDKPVVTNRQNFHYENTNGLNYIHARISRTDKLYQSKNKIFGLSSTFGLGLGCLLTINDLNFAQQFDRYTASISGLGISAHAGLRLEIYRHFFIQAELNGGWINLTHVRTRPRDKSAYADQKYWFGQRNVVMGFFIYIKSQSVCQDCPVW